MRKVLLITYLFLIAAVDWVQAQYIRTEQYTVLIERRVKKQSNPVTCYRYAPGSEFDDPSTPWPDEPYFPYEDIYNLGNYGRSGVPDNLYEQYMSWWWVPDHSCSTCGNDSKIEMWYKPVGGDPYVVGQTDNLDYNNMQPLEERVYYDTLRLLQPFNIEYLDSRILEKAVYDIEDWSMNPAWNLNCDWRYWKESAYQPKGPNLLYPSAQLSSVQSNYTSYNDKFELYTKIQVIPSPDVSYNLPSHDRILISHYKAGSFNTQIGPTNFQFQDPLTGIWHDVPQAFYKNSETLELSGYDLFGEGYIDRLNATVNIKVSNTFFGFIQPQIAAFTLRLSSPHITSTTPNNLVCYERNDGSFKIQFDRALLPQEKLNILIYDTASKVNYSELNLTTLAADNSFTWPNELRAGTYHISLIGKYAKGTNYDLTVNTRIDTIPKYTALNSINFEDGFNTPQTDDFEAYTDYTGMSLATYTGSIKHWAFQKLEQPLKIRFSAAVQNNVVCKGSATGSMVITAYGGILHRVGEYDYLSNYKYSLKREGDAEYSPWVAFTNHGDRPGLPEYVYTTQGVNNLKAGNYLLRVRDEADCYARDSAGNEVTYSFTIKEPEKGITLDLYEVSPITRHDAADAQVKIQINGGTPFITTPEVAHDPYNVVFYNKNTPSETIPLTNTVLEANKRMQSVTPLLGEGTYVLRIYDAYYVSDSDSGCFFEMEIPILKPEELLVSIKNKKQVSCYDSTDGKLLADATGGIKIDGLKYTFKWYKVTNEGNSLLTDTDSLLENVGAGSYQVEVTDKYNNKKLSDVFVFTQPTPLLLDPTSIPTNCYTDSNGVLQVAVTGGTPFGDGSYRYEWSTGDRTAVVNKVLGGDYLIVVTDSMFCMAIDTVTVTSPVRILPNPVVNQVTCRGKCDGQIALTPTGGNGVYTYTWNTGATTPTISNLCPGTYTYTVTDVGGCSESGTIEIPNPDTLAVYIGEDRKICIGQTIRLDATASDTAVLTYNWESDNGFTASTAKVAITQAGTYRVAVSNNGGCVVRDTVVITAQNSNINTDYVVSTQAFTNENVTLVNISQPRTDSVRWLIPSMGNVIRPVIQTNDKCELIFSDTGRYAITMQAYYASGCIDDTTKTVNVINRGGTVTSGDQSNAYLQAYAVIYPNPNNGTFTVNLNFSEVTRARLRLINTLTNVTVDDRLIQGEKDYFLNYNMGTLMSGVYILVIDASKGSFVYKVLIAH